MSLYRIENRYQDSGWEPTSESYPSFDQASARASVMADDGICWGMTRVVGPQGVLITYRAGGGVSETRQPQSLPWTVETRYQGPEWLPTGESFRTYVEAYQKAAEIAEFSTEWGEVRVVAFGGPQATFAAGGGSRRLWPDQYDGADDVGPEKPGGSRLARWLRRAADWVEEGGG